MVNARPYNYTQSMEHPRWRSHYKGMLIGPGGFSSNGLGGYTTILGTGRDVPAGPVSYFYPTPDSIGPMVGGLRGLGQFSFDDPSMAPPTLGATCAVDATGKQTGACVMAPGSIPTSLQTATGTTAVNIIPGGTAPTFPVVTPPFNLGYATGSWITGSTGGIPNVAWLGLGVVVLLMLATGRRR